MWMLENNKLEELLQLWNNYYEVFIPQKSYDSILLMPYKKNALSLNYINFSQPVKEFLFKSKERLFSWEKSNDNIELGQNNEPISNKILFGIRSCDARGIAYMDKFFQGEYCDGVYKENREHTIIIGLNCANVGENCFCASMETGPLGSAGNDLIFTPKGDKYYIEVLSKKGEALIEIGKQFFVEETADILGIKQELLENLRTKFVASIYDNRVSDILEKSFNDEIWEELAAKCIKCGGCTNVCPTCTCFNVVEENITDLKGNRVRYWDSCQSDSFTKNAGEHKPRNDVARVRYRIYDKLKYIEERFGHKGCTGCGRCINTCPVDINIVAIMNKLSENYRTAYHPLAALTTLKDPIRAVESRPQNWGPQGFKTSEEYLTKKLNLQTNNLKEIKNNNNKFEIHVHNNCEEVYVPQIAIIKDIIDETRNIKKFLLQYEDMELHKNFEFSGQFFEITVFGVGEIAISIPFSPTQKDYFDFCVKKVGKVTRALHEMKIGDKVGLRGPFGKGFPFEEMKGKDILIVGSGVGVAPVRTVIARIAEEREAFGKVVVIGSALSYEELIYKSDFFTWEKKNIKILYAFNKPTQKVKAHVGFINDLLPQLDNNWEETRAILCASPRRIKEVAKDLIKLGMDGKNIYTSLETHMRCGIGKCGHCKVGNKYMCVDGPVFNYEEMLQLPPEF